LEDLRIRSLARELARHGDVCFEQGQKVPDLTPQLLERRRPHLTILLVALDDFVPATDLILDLIEVGLYLIHLSSPSLIARGVTRDFQKCRASLVRTHGVRNEVERRFVQLRARDSLPIARLLSNATRGTQL